MIRQHLSGELMTERTVFITGGGSGINLGIAKTFAAVGANLAICGRTKSRLDIAATELRDLGAEVSCGVAGVRDDEVVVAALERSRRELGPADAVVCGAAGNFFAPAESMSSKGFRTVIDIDLLGSFNTARAAFDQGISAFLDRHSPEFADSVTAQSTDYFASWPEPEYLPPAGAR